MPGWLGSHKSVLAAQWITKSLKLLQPIHICAVFRVVSKVEVSFVDGTRNSSTHLASPRAA